MRHLQFLAVVFASLQYVAALPSISNLPRNAPSPTLERIFPETDSLSRRDTAQPEGISQTPRLNARQSSNLTSPAVNATVELCTEPQFQGECLNSTWPVNTCIALNGYAGAVRSIDPKEGFECLLTQGRCNVATPYISIGSDPSDTAGDDLSSLSWIEESNSYICFTEIEMLRRYVQMRLRTPVKEAT
ncbi:hypothetical protein CKM354_000958700 [Cercospora kikuchii]|uniref:Uncharacterized protein n=1 Tax=Cercospora kikuchii TaxID=84275 RepID=A0A9P3CPU0_9PEZI|nr:uncharacterized protein CKM354_000958700 [Cercospora kikuchii]GIZ46461.1 hypothetical protein CKM354_000958700 [Cercospora kikuchii]